MGDKKLPNTCATCGSHYDLCRYPVSHSHPTTNSIKLPGRASRILAARDRRGHSTLQERMTLNSIDIFPPDFTTYIDGVI